MLFVALFNTFDETFAAGSGVFFASATGVAAGFLTVGETVGAAAVVCLSQKTNPIRVNVAKN